eukprot:6452554-Amphidinium_carterae.1
MNYSSDADCPRFKHHFYAQGSEVWQQHPPPPPHEVSHKRSWNPKTLKTPRPPTDPQTPE